MGLELGLQRVRQVGHVRSLPAPVYLFGRLEYGEAIRRLLLFGFSCWKKEQILAEYLRQPQGEVGLANEKSDSTPIHPVTC